MFPIKRIFGFWKKNELEDNSIQDKSDDIGSSRREFITKGLLGVAGIGGLALASKAVKAGGLVFNDGSEQLKAAGWVELQSVTASDSATVDLENGIGSDYDEYMIKMTNLVPATDSVQPYIRLKVGGSYQTSGYDYHGIISIASAATYGGISGTSADFIRLSASTGSASGEGMDCTLFFSSPDSTASYKRVYSTGILHEDSGVVRMTYAVGSYTGATSALTGVRFYFQTGNITSGTFTLYGLKKS